MPSLSASRQAQMYPAARRLVRMASDVGATPIFFLTWGHRDGWPEHHIADYSSMQVAIDQAYLAIAREQHTAVAPVGYAWWTLVGQEAQPGLWQDDGSHPTPKGTYLAACVFYATIFGASPEGLRYHGTVPGDEAARLQTLAAHTVLGDPLAWGLR